MNPLGSFLNAPPLGPAITRLWYGLTQTRELLTANRTYYVSTTGSDTNTGLTTETPFATIQKAVDTVCTKIDMADYQVTIQLADGTYTSGAVLKPYVGIKAPIIRGNTVTPNNVLINTSSTCVLNNSNSYWIITYFKTQSTSESCVSTDGTGSYIGLISINFGSAINGYHAIAQRGGRIQIIGNYTVSGGAINHIATQAGYLNGGYGTNNTITIIGTPTFSGAFAQAYDLGYLQYSHKIFSGAVTGKRYFATMNGVISTYGSGTSFFPGSIAGTTSTGGLYT